MRPSTPNGSVCKLYVAASQLASPSRCPVHRYLQFYGSAPWMEFRPLRVAGREFAPIYFPSSDAAVIHIRKGRKNSMRCRKGNRHRKSTLVKVIALNTLRGKPCAFTFLDEVKDCDVFVRYRTDQHLFLWITSHPSNTATCGLCWKASNTATSR